MDFHGFPQKSGIFHGKPWNSIAVENEGGYTEFRGKCHVEASWKLMETPWDLRGNGMELEKENTMELHGPVAHGRPVAHARSSVEIEWNLKECTEGRCTCIFFFGLRGQSCPDVSDALAVRSGRTPLSLLPLLD